MGRLPNNIFHFFLIEVVIKEVVRGGKETFRVRLILDSRERKLN